MTGLQNRVAKLEADILPVSPGWFCLETWEAERHLRLDERERRRLAAHPEQAGEIAAHFGRVRQRLAEWRHCGECETAS